MKTFNEISDLVDKDFKELIEDNDVHDIASYIGMLFMEMFANTELQYGIDIARKAFAPTAEVINKCVNEGCFKNELNE